MGVSLLDICPPGSWQPHAVGLPTVSFLAVAAQPACSQGHPPLQPGAGNQDPGERIHPCPRKAGAQRLNLVLWAMLRGWAVLSFGPCHLTPQHQCSPAESGCGGGQVPPQPTPHCYWVYMRRGMRRAGARWLKGPGHFSDPTQSTHRVLGSWDTAQVAGLCLQRGWVWKRGTWRA